MNNKKTGRLTGILFIAATAAGVASLSFISVKDGNDFAAQINQNPNTLLVGAFLILLMGIFCSAIAFSIYPMLSKHSKGLAIGAAGFRTIEGGIFIASAGILAAMVPAAAYSQDAAAVLRIAHESVSENAAFAFCVGALLYYIGFYKTKLVPRWLSIWGIAAIILHFGANVSVFFGAESFSTVNVIINIPIAIQEMVLAVWLLIFGFKEVPAREKIN
ncbi:MAG: DUF4386 domain-containing protein [Eubacteriales bacterium]